MDIETARLMWQEEKQILLDELSNEKERHSETLGRLQKQESLSDQLRDENSHLKHQLDDEKRRTISSQKGLAELQKQLLSAQHKLRQWRKNAEDASSANEELTSKVAALESLVSSPPPSSSNDAFRLGEPTTVAESPPSHDDDAGHLNTAPPTMAMLMEERRNLDSARRKNSDLQAKLDRSLESYSSLKAKYDSDRRTWNSREKRLMEERDTFASESQRLGHAYEDSNADVVLLKSEVNALQSQLESFPHAAPPPSDDPPHMATLKEAQAKLDVREEHIRLRETALSDEMESLKNSQHILDERAAILDGKAHDLEVKEIALNEKEQMLQDVAANASARSNDAIAQQTALTQREFELNEMEKTLKSRETSLVEAQKAFEDAAHRARNNGLREDMRREESVAEQNDGISGIRAEVRLCRVEKQFGIFKKKAVEDAHRRQEQIVHLERDLKSKQDLAQKVEDLKHELETREKEAVEAVESKDAHIAKLRSALRQAETARSSKESPWNAGIQSLPVTPRSQDLSSSSGESDLIERVASLSLEITAIKHDLEVVRTERDELKGAQESIQQEKEETEKKLEIALKGKEEAEREKEIVNARKEQTVREMEQTIREMEQTIREREQTIHDMEQTIREMEQTSVEKQQTVHDMEQTIREMEQTSVDKDNAIKMVEKAMHEMDEAKERALTEKKAAEKQRDEAIANMKDAILEKEEATKAITHEQSDDTGSPTPPEDHESEGLRSEVMRLKQALEEAKNDAKVSHMDKLDAIKTAEQAEIEKQEAIKAAEQSLQGEEDALNGEERAERERDEAIREKNAMIREKDAAIRERDEAIRERDAAMIEKERSLALCSEIQSAKERAEQEKQDLERLRDELINSKSQAEMDAEEAKQHAAEMASSESQETKDFLTEANREKEMAMSRHQQAMRALEVAHGEKEELQRELEESQKELEDLQREKQENQREREELQREMERSQKEMGALQREREESLKETEDLVKRMEEAQKQLDESQKQLDESQKQLDESQKQLDESQKQLDESQKQLDESQKQLDESQKQLEESQKQLEELQKPLEESQKEHEESRNEEDDECMTPVPTQHESHEQDTTAQSEVKRLQVLLDGVEEEKYTLMEESNTLMENMERMKEEHKALEQKLQKRIDTLSARCKATGAGTMDEKQQASHAGRDSKVVDDKLRSRLRESEERRRRAEKAYRESKEKSEALQASLKKTQAQAERIRSAYRKARASATKSTPSDSSKSNSLGEMKRKLRALQEEKQRLVSSSAEHSRERVKMTRLRERWRGERAGLLDEKSALEAESASLREECARLRAKLRGGGGGRGARPTRRDAENAGEKKRQEADVIRQEADEIRQEAETLRAEAQIQREAVQAREQALERRTQEVEKSLQMRQESVERAEADLRLKEEGLEQRITRAHEESGRLGETAVEEGEPEEGKGMADGDVYVVPQQMEVDKLRGEISELKSLSEETLEALQQSKVEHRRAQTKVEALQKEVDSERGNHAYTLQLLENERREANRLQQRLEKAKRTHGAPPPPPSEGKLEKATGVAALKEEDAESSRLEERCANAQLEAEWWRLCQVRARAHGLQQAHRAADLVLSFLRAHSEAHNEHSLVSGGIESSIVNGVLPPPGSGDTGHHCARFVEGVRAFLADGSITAEDLQARADAYGDTLSSEAERSALQKVQGNAVLLRRILRSFKDELGSLPGVR